MKKALIIAVLICLLSVGLLACEEEKIKVADVTGMNAQEASDLLKESGFTTVTLSADSSGESSIILDSSNWTVVTQTPEAGSEETAETEITLSCKKTEELESNQLNEVLNLTVPEAKAKLDDLGYTATYFHQDSGLEITEDLSVYSDSELGKWIVTGLQSHNIESKTVEVIVNTSENIASNEASSAIKKTLEETLSASSAWQATDEYGKSQYPYGFELHYIMGKLAEQPENETTWFLKAECTITNEYGAESDATCEAKVSGTSDSPEVTSFSVY